MRDHVLCQTRVILSEFYYIPLILLETHYLVVRPILELLLVLLYRRDNKEPLQGETIFCAKPVRYLVSHTMHSTPSFTWGD